MQYRQWKPAPAIRPADWSRLVFLSVLSGGLGLLPATGLAETIDTYASYTAEYNSNVLLQPVTPIGDLAHLLEVGTYYQQTGKQLEARIIANVRYRHYSNGTLPDEVLPSLDASQTWYLSPDRFHWFIQDRMSQIAIDPLASPSPANQETFNVFATGPTFKARFGPVDSVELEARYFNTFYSQTFDDSDSMSGKMKWLHTISPITDLSTSLEAQKVTFVHGAFDDYDVYEAVFGLKTRRRFTTISVDLGGTAINRATANDRLRPLGKLSIDSHPTPANRIGLSLEAGFTDLTREVLELPLLKDTTIQTGNIFYGMGADAVYEQTWAPTKASFHLFFRDRDYIDATPDEYVYGGELDVSRDFNPRFSGSVYGSYARTDYISVSVAPTTDLGVGMRSVYRLRKDLMWTAETRWARRDSTDPTRRYDGFIAMVSILYGHRPDPKQ